jgi:alanyl-tRNA synthetase
VKAPTTELENRINDALDELKTAQKRIAELEAQQAMQLLPSLVAAATKVAGLNVVAVNIDQDVNAEQLKALTAAASEQLGADSVVILGASISSKPLAMIAAGIAAQRQGVRAGDLAKIAAAALGGGGGGKADFAQGGGTDSSKLAKAIQEAVAAIK